MGESTAESGPRCGEAEEAKRRPAIKLGACAACPCGAIERPGGIDAAPFVIYIRRRWRAERIPNARVLIPVDPPSTPRVPFRARGRHLDSMRPFQAAPNRRAETRRGGRNVTEKEPNKVTAWRQLGVLSAIPFILGGAPAAGFFLGH